MYTSLLLALLPLFAPPLFAPPPPLAPPPPRLSPSPSQFRPQIIESLSSIRVPEGKRREGKPREKENPEKFTENGSENELEMKLENVVLTEK